MSFGITEADESKKFFISTDENSPYTFLPGDKIFSQLKEISGKDTLPQTYINGECKGTCAEDIMKAEKSGKLYEWLGDAEIKYSKLGSAQEKS